MNMSVMSASVDETSAINAFSPQPINASSSQTSSAIRTSSSAQISSLPQPSSRASAPITVLLVDDEDIVRYGLKAICQVDRSLKIVGEANNGKDAIAQAQAHQPDVILMDINMPVMNGIQAMQVIGQQHPNIKVLILTAYEDDEHLVEAMQHGASGYLLKNTPPEDLAHIIWAAHKGYMQVGPQLGQRLCNQLKPRRSGKAAKNAKGITPREQEVLDLIAEGASNREIAGMLHITEKTVKNHVSNLLRRVGLRDRTQLALWTVQFSSVQASEHTQRSEQQMAPSPAEGIVVNPNLKPTGGKPTGGKPAEDDQEWRCEKAI
ncbi:MAG: response regulator [Phormidesmis sp.]